ncbi:hypothetical protein Tco_0407543 [Tanacetum coccineum]
MDNPNITMEEYIRLQEEKSLSRGETFNWQTATYGKMEYCEDEDDCFTNFESVNYQLIVLMYIREALSGTSCFYYSIIKDKDEGKSHAGTLIDIPVFVGSFSIISGFTIIDDDDMTKDVVLGMKFCKKYASCQMIMKKFALGDKCEQIMEGE